MTSEAHLIDTTLFRGAVLAPVGLGLLLIIVAAIQSREELSLCLEASCFNNFFSLFKFQLGVMGIAIPLGALVASHHRSIQAAQQIKTQLRQNTFSNYIDHRQLFEQFFRDNNPLRFKEVKNHQIWELYQIIFPNSAHGDLTPNVRIDDFLYELADSYCEISKHIEKDLSPTTLDLTESDIARFYTYVNARIDNFLGINRPSTPDGLTRDPVTQLLEFSDFTSSMASGLQDCVNFHQFFKDHPAVQKIYDESIVFEGELKALRGINDARLKILNALENATDEVGNLNSQDQFSSESLRRRLEEFTDTKNPRDFISPEDALIVFETYVASSHKGVLLGRL